MPATDIETIGLDLVGNFDTKAAAAAKSALNMASAIDTAAAAAARLKGTPDSVGHAIDQLAGKYIKAKEAATAAADTAQKYRLEAERAYRVGNKGWADFLSTEADALHALPKQVVKDPPKPPKTDVSVEKTVSAYDALKERLAQMAPYVAAVYGYWRLIRGAVGEVAELTQYGIERSAARASQVRVLDKLTDGEGAIAYRVTLTLAGEKGVDPSVAGERVKGLIQAGFGRSDTELLFRAAADLGEVKGAEKAKTFLEQLEKTGAKGTVNEESLNGLAEAGVEAAAVLDRLRRSGEGLDTVRARVKAGQVAVTDFARAVGAAVEDKLGGAAGAGLDAQIARLKIAGAGLFDSFDLEPLRGAVDTVVKMLESPTGTELKKGITDVGDAALGLFAVLKTDSGQKSLKDFMESATTIAESLAAVLRRLNAEVQTLANWHVDGGIFSHILEALDSPRTRAAEALNKDPRDTAAESIVEAQVKHAQEVRAAEEARAAGRDIGAGYAAGIKDSSPAVSDAVRDTLGAGIEAGNEKLDRHSPSKIYREMGRDSSLGYALGANDNAGVAADATANMAEQSIAAARRPRLLGAGGDQGGGGGGVAGAGVVVQMGGVVINVTAAPGVSTAEARAMGEAAGDAFRARVQAVARDMGRDRNEFSVGGALR